MRKLVNCNSCIYREKIIINNWGFYICLTSGIMLEDLMSPIECSRYKSVENLLTKEELELLNRLKNYRFNITLQSIKKDDLKTIYKLQSLGLIHIYTSWIKTSENNYRKIKMIEVVRNEI